MLREVLHSKIHMATVTGAKPHYVGSVTIDADLLDACGMRVNDKVLISNCRNGNRLETYIFRGKPGSGVIELNGAAAHLVEAGDKIIIMHFGLLTDAQYAENRPTVLIMNDDNTVRETMHYEPFGGHPPA
jgi:aspartate 1-decarboxylase